MSCAATNNPCTTTSCDPVQGCVTHNNSNTCNDNNLCTVGDQCSGGVCKPGTLRTCGANQVCEPTTGSCRCMNNAIMCNNVCVLTACCPGAYSGPCGRCGMWRCNDQGTSLVCTGQNSGANTCDPGWTCSGPTCHCPDGSACACATGLHRECDASCNVTGCF
jgi:hypothetical protein